MKHAPSGLLWQPKWAVGRCDAEKFEWKTIVPHKLKAACVEIMKLPSILRVGCFVMTRKQECFML